MSDPQAPQPPAQPPAQAPAQTPAELTFNQQMAVGAIARYFEGSFPEQAPAWRTVGREAEYPIVLPNGWPAQVERLWPLLKGDGFEVKTEVTAEGKELIVGLEGADFTYSAEVGWGTIEVILRPCQDLHEIRALHETAMRRLVEAADKLGIYVLGHGIQPMSPAHPGLMTKKQRYGALLEILGKPWLTFTLTASDQVHVPLGRAEVIPMTNLGNVLAPFTVGLLANSGIYSGEDSYHCSGREQIMGTIHADQGRHGMPHRPYASIPDMIESLARLPLLLTREDDKLLPYSGGSFLDYVEQTGISGEPLIKAFLLHEHYVWHSARPRTAHGTVEMRAACQQPWPDHMVVAALGLGVVEAGMKIHDFLFSFVDPPRAPKVRPGVRQPPDPERVPWDMWPPMRAWHHEAIAKGLESDPPFTGLVEGVLRLCQDALAARGRGEERYLQPLFDRAARRSNPAQDIRRIFHRAGPLAAVEAMRIKRWW